MSSGKRSGKFINVMILLLTVSVGFLMLEAGSRLIWKKKYNQLLEKQLHGFDQVDYQKSLLVPIPGTEISVQEYRERLLGHGKPIGLAYVEELIQREGLKPEDLILKINRHGFKGRDFDIPKSASTFRIIALGDSVTWGQALDRYSYPRVLEEELNRRRGEGVRFEVVNAGVGGYNIESLLKRLDMFLAVDPDLVLVYIGWNRTIGRADFRKNAFLYRTLYLYKVYYHLIKNRKGLGLKEDYNATTFYDPNSPEMERFDHWSFAYDMEDLEVLVERIRKRNKNIRIALITLAGLFDWRVDPDLRAKRIGYPIASTNNLYAWAVLTRNSNEALRRLAREKNLILIDFESYALESFVPRSAYFSDSVHPTAGTFRNMGLYFADELTKILDVQVQGANKEGAS